MSRQINQAGLDLIKEFEGCRLEVYLDQKGLPTVGWGHRTDMSVGTTISQEDADTLLSDDLSRFEVGVEHAVAVDPTDNQFAALVSFAYNLGLGALRSSHLLTEFNAGNLDKAADELLKWCHLGTEEDAGLLRRREAERSLFLKEDL